MGSVEQLVGSLLSGLHGLVQPPVCRGDWLSTVTLLGALLALLPVVAAILIALIRKGTGNRYNVAVCATFGLIGLVFCLGLPWFGFRGASGVFRKLFIGTGTSGLTPSDVASIDRRSCIVDNQRAHLGGGQTVYQALTGPHPSSTQFGVEVALLVIAPLLCLIFVALQARVALRRGQKWPSRFMWVPMVALIAATWSLRAGTVEELWLGFVPVSAIGILLVVFAGKPRWAVINRSAAPRRSDRPAPAGYSPNGYGPEAYQPVEYERAPAAERLAIPDEPAPHGGGAATREFTEVATAAPEPPTAPVVASGRFQRVRTLGSGGFGTVWLAMDTHLDRTVAVKFAHIPDAETEQRIRREARALAAVHHPNCVRIYDIVVEPDGVGIVMEYIDGALLSDVVRRDGPLDDVAAGRLWVTMAGALEAAHAQNVLHRDVKPSNVIVDRQGVPHLIDFGIARASGDNTLTGTGMMVGTPDYLAPEIARNAPPTRAADCWQLAATVSYALSANPPRGRRTNVMSAMMAAAQQDPCTELPAGSVHAKLLRAALDSDPAKRPSLATIRHEVSGWLARSGHSEDGPVANTEVIRAEK